MMRCVVMLLFLIVADIAAAGEQELPALHRYGDEAAEQLAGLVLVDGDAAPVPALPPPSAPTPVGPIIDWTDLPPQPVLTTLFESLFGRRVDWVATDGELIAVNGQPMQLSDLKKLCTFFERYQEALPNKFQSMARAIHAERLRASRLFCNLKCLSPGQAGEIKALLRLPARRQVGERALHILVTLIDGETDAEGNFAYRARSFAEVVSSLAVGPYAF